MTRRSIAILGAASVLAVVVLWVARRAPPRDEGTPATPHAWSGRVAGDALARLRAVPFYRSLLRPDTVRSASLAADGAVRIDIDLPALLRPRLERSDLAALAELLPRSARGAIHVDTDGSGRANVHDESWLFEGPAPLLDVLERGAQARSAGAAWDAIPGTPSAVAGACIAAPKLADPAFGGQALAVWRERAEIAEKVLGRPLRAEIADDLAGPVVFALYDASSESEAHALLVVELKRSDRVGALLDSVFALGALTERATIRRYRDVATGSFRPAGDGPGVAVAVDPPLLLAASSRALLEAAIDARRGERRVAGIVGAARASDGSWSAVTTSAFVTHGWTHIARAEDPSRAPFPSHDARLNPEGATAWRLVGNGPGPAITTDPVLPFLRFALGGRQRGAGGAG